MRIAISGSKGQLGLALQEVLGRPDGPGDATLLLDLPEHDITDLAATTAAIAAFRPQVIIHGAALTDVDRCEREPDLAYRVNALGTRNLAVAAQQVGAAMVYVSTDYVFPGRPEPYWEYDRPEPLSVYARTKWYGEQIVRDLLPRHYIARTAWMYGRGPRNFVRTVLRLADERGAMQMVTTRSARRPTPCTWHARSSAWCAPTPMASTTWRTRASAPATSGPARCCGSPGARGSR